MTDLLFYLGPFLFTAIFFIPIFLNEKYSDWFGNIGGFIFWAVIFFSFLAVIMDYSYK